MKNNLRKYLRYVGQGGRATIYKRNTAVAALVPAHAAANGPSARLAANIERLAREGIVRRGTGKVPVDQLDQPFGEASGVLDCLLAERASG